MTKSYIKYRFRVGVITSAVILFWVVLCMRLFSIQVFQGKEHRERFIAQSHRKESIPSERGNIFDRNNDALTRNIAHYTISVNPSKVIDKTILAKELQNITGKPFDYYIKKLNSKRSFEFLERNIKNKIEKLSRSDIITNRARKELGMEMAAPETLIVAINKYKASDL